jgi:DNA-binding response OmpR family regulator
MKVIHVIENDPDILEAILMMLKIHHLDGDGYPHGLHLAKGKFRKPHLFLIDCQLPAMSGPQICKYLKSHPVLSVVPVVLMSAQRRFESICKALGAVAFVNKPFEMRALMEVVNGHSSALETR